ncbi:MAG: zinc dependent phospholipase C family protein [Hydrogenophilales bacterium]|nr:zinc dependent phospholipase C family protein [Hydrogenophilales bacterium]
MRHRPWCFILIPLLLHSAEALAWGLATHLYFSQLLLWAVPLLDPRLRAAAKRLPHLVLAGSCLPDLALVGRVAKTGAFEDTHHWAQAARLLAHAGSDEARAIALGYASHLFVDVIAHNHFVPAHERMWLKLPMVTHAMSEWAMDAHIARHLFAMPPRLLRDHHATLARYITAEFDCDAAEAERALVYLRHATAFLYGSRAHRLLYVGAASLDRRLARRFDYYVTETAARLPQINRLLVGEAPSWRADLACPERTGHLRHLSRDEARGTLPLPASLFA